MSLFVTDNHQKQLQQQMTLMDISFPHLMKLQKRPQRNLYGTGYVDEKKYFGLQNW